QRPGDSTQSFHMVGKMRRAPNPRDLLPTQRTPAQVGRLVQTNMHVAWGAKSRNGPQEFLRHLKRTGMHGTDLPGLPRRTIWRAEFVQLTQLRNLDQVLGVPEQIDDRNYLDANASGCVDQ